MIQMRYEKRKFDKDSEDPPDNKKIKIESDSDSDSDSGSFIPESCESEVQTHESDVDELDENIDNAIDTYKSRLRPRTNLEPSQIQEIIKESIKNLIKKYKDNDKDFLNEEKDRNDPYDPYEQFHELVESIYDGEFFERIPLEDRLEKLKEEYTVEQINEMTNELQTIKNVYKNSSPSILDVLKMKCPLEQKQKLIEKIHTLVNSETLSSEYTSNIKFLNSNISSVNPENAALLELEERILKSAVNSSIFDSYKHKILKSKMSFDNKVIAYKKLEIMETYEETDTSEYSKYKNWMDTLLSIPFGVYNDIPVKITSEESELRQYIKQVRTTLDNKLSFLEKPKDQIINIITQMIRNPSASINSIGLHGGPGLGKTSIATSIAEALGRQLRSISLGGESDASTLTGHNFTYIGSGAGRFIEILRESKTMNPVVLIDEIDKISTTQHGKEIIGTLIHLTDSTSNNKYNYDRYFSGVEFDLSKVLFIFTYNDPDKVDPILADRLYKIKVENYTTKEKLNITNTHIIKNELDKFNFDNTQLTFTEEAVNYLVNKSSSDQGMRDIKTKFKIIMSRINTLLLTEETDCIVNLKYKQLYPFYKKLPVVVPKEHIDILLDESIDGGTNSNIPFGMYN
jgi:ATP-dependent Lon protease